MIKTAEQIKGTIRNMTRKSSLYAQEVLQMFFFERILVRLAHSKYQRNFILKGGLLISSIISINERTTMDMDTTVVGVQMEESEIEQIIKEILAIEVDDDIIFEYERIEPIRDEDAYNNFRVHLFAKFDKINAPMKIDITTGDIITYSAIKYDFPMLFEDTTIPVMAYNLETVLAEKYETIIRRNISTTRARDFYDLHILYQSQKLKIDIETLRTAILNTAEKRGSLEDIINWQSVLHDLYNEQQLYLLWNNYAVENKYIGNLKFESVLETLQEVSTLLNF